jgi:autotransporter-associated beta strand protein
MCPSRFDVTPCLETPRTRIPAGQHAARTSLGRDYLLPSAGLLLAIDLLAGLSVARAQPDYPPAHYTPMVGCEKWWTTPADAVAYYATKWGETGPGGHYFCVIHDMEGYYWTTISYLNTCSVSASIHYMVNGLKNGSDSHGHAENNPSDPAAGDITQSVREAYYAWHVVCWNPYMFGTEHEGFVNDPAWYSEAMYQASAGLQRHLCDAWGIPKDRNHIIGHNEWQNSTWNTWMAANYPRINTTCNNHTDPGIYWNWAHFMTLITNAPGGTYWDPNGATTGAGSTPSGTWDTNSLNWSTNSAGASLTGTWSGGGAIFSAGSDATGSYTINVSGTQTVTNLWVKNGTVTFTGGQLNFTGTGPFYSNNISAGCSAVFNTPFGGAGSPDKWGPGLAVYNGASTSAGFFSLNQGTLGLGNDAALSTAPLRVGDSGGVNFVTLQSANATPHTLANNLVLYASAFSFGAGGNLTFGGYVDVGTSSSVAKSISVSNNVTTFSGIISNTAGLAKIGPGTLVLSGASANTYGSISANGNTTVSGGTLQLSKTAGVAAVPNGSLVLNAGGTLLLGAANQIGDAVPMTLGGGTFQTGGYSEQLGTLKVTANSVIDLGAGASVLKFDDSSGIAWTAATTLTITNWAGAVYGGGADQLVFGADSSGLMASQVSQVWFANPAGLAVGTYLAAMLSTGEVVPLTAPPTLSGAGQLANGQFLFSLTGVPGYDYAVFGSTNLSDWTPLETNVSPFTFLDTNASLFPARYYRAQSVP